MGGLWPGITQRLTHFRWQLAGLVALVIVLACVLVVPQWLVQWELGASARTLTAPERAKAINDVRGTLLQGIGGAVLLLGAYFTYRQLQTGRDQLEVTRQQAQAAAAQARDQLEITRQQAQATAQQVREQLEVAQQGQVTERFTRATDQLGHAELNVRIGGIYALERIANDSPDDRNTIAEVLTAFVRDRAPWPPRPGTQPSADTPIKEVPELQVRVLDVQAALTVLLRRRPPPSPSRGLDLHATDLRKALLDGANLQGADLSRAGLQGADLSRAGLQGASLSRAQLQKSILRHAELPGVNLTAARLEEADLERANLQGANLERAKLQKAVLRGANLEDSNLREAELQEAKLSFAKLSNARLVQANLQKATLWGTELREANLKDVKLQGAILEDAQLQRATLTGADLQEAILKGARLEDAHADPTTNWPEGFDPSNAGIQLDPYANTTGETES